MNIVYLFALLSALMIVVGAFCIKGKKDTDDVTAQALAIIYGIVILTSVMFNL